MDIHEPDRDPLLIGDVDASDTRHLRLSLAVGVRQWQKPLLAEGAHYRNARPKVNGPCGMRAA
jgi:hypothetical protein